jgi:site-specific recombinase XerD
MDSQVVVASADVLFGGMVSTGSTNASGVLDLMRTWAEALDLFFASRKAENTRRSYRRSIQEFLAYSEKMPWQVNKADMQRWVDALRGRGLTDETINLRVAAVSAFYTFCMNDYEITHPDGRASGLTDYNPAAAKSLRAKVVPYGKASPLGVNEVRALIKAIRLDTVQGLRDAALIVTYLYTARRNSEIRLLQWKHIILAGSRPMYRWSGKGHDDEKYELPLPAWDAIQAYLKASERLDGMKDDDYIFIPHSDHHKRLPNMKGVELPDNRPLSMRQMGDLLKKYARHAGLRDDLIHVHTLRHTGAHLRLEAGDDIQDISDLLCHSSLAVTQIYLHRTGGKKDLSWQKVEALIGLS